MKIYVLVSRNASKIFDFWVKKLFLKSPFVPSPSNLEDLEKLEKSVSFIFDQKIKEFQHSKTFIQNSEKIREFKNLKS